MSASGPRFVVHIARGTALLLGEGLGLGLMRCRLDLLTGDFDARWLLNDGQTLVDNVSQYMLLEDAIHVWPSQRGRCSLLYRSAHSPQTRT